MDLRINELFGFGDLPTKVLDDVFSKPIPANDFLEMGPYDFERSEKLRHHSLVDRTIEPPDCVKEFSSALVGGFLQGILDAFRMFSCVTFSRFNGISRILEWRYQVPYFWPYFGGISPCIALKNRPHIW